MSMAVKSMLAEDVELESRPLRKNFTMQNGVFLQIALAIANMESVVLPRFREADQRRHSVDSYWRYYERHAPMQQALSG